MNRLSTFLSLHPIPAVLTSRPRGYKQLRFEEDWHTGKLAPFDEMQIESFAQTWFKYLESPEPTGKKTDLPERTNTEQRKEEFLKAVHSNSNVMDLARTPLFCQLLIDLFRHSHQLPERRFKLYEKIVELLLSEHPAARIHAAGLTSVPERAEIEDIDEMLQRLALHIQKIGGSGVASAADCLRIFRGFLCDDINGLGYPPHEARKQAQAIIDYSQTGLGLLVERAPGELGFFHLTIQEYLSAKAMIRTEEKEQLEWLSQVWNQPRWHEVVLSWFGIKGSMSGKEAIQRAIEYLKNTAQGPFAKLQLLRLRTELAAGDFGLPPRQARETIEEAAGQVETTPFPELRQELARHITLGLRSPSVAEQTEKRIAAWAPARSKWDRARLLETFAGWQQSEDLLYTLRRALHDEEGPCSWAAAESLAKVYGPDPGVGNDLAALARNWPETGVQAAALHGLGLGWPNYDSLTGLADHATDSVDTDISLAGISVRVAQHKQSESDFQKIWSMLEFDTISYDMHNFFIRTLIEGWRNDEQVKRLVLEALREQSKLGFSSKDLLLPFLVEAWPGDPEVGKSLADLFSGQGRTIYFHSDIFGENLFKGFRENKDILKSIRKNLLEERSKSPTIFMGPDTKWAYCVIGDETAKREVLEAYHSVKGNLDKLWAVSTLMEAWPEDKEIKNFINREFQRPPGETAYLSPWIKAFISNTHDRKKWLIGAVEHADNDIIRHPVNILLSEFKDEEVLKVVLPVLEKNLWYYDKKSIQNLLIMNYPDVPLVRQWAESSFSEIEGPSLSCIAVSYQNDPKLRERLLSAARPAKEDVRREVFRILREYSVPTERAMRLTGEIWAEESGEVRSAGIVARCISAKDLLELKERLVNRLKEEIISVGMHVKGRRRSALAGFLQLEEYTMCAEAISKEKSPPSLNWLIDYIETDSIAISLFFNHWERLQKAFSEKSLPFEIPWRKLINTEMAGGILPDGKIRNLLIDYLKTMQSKDHTTASLSLMAETIPKSELLRTCLIDVIKKDHIHESFSVLRIYAEQFGGDEEALKELQKCWSLSERPDTMDPSFLYALSLGWPGSPLLRSFIENTKNPISLPLITVLSLCGITGKDANALECIDALIQMRTEKSWGIPDIYRQSLMDWARTPTTEKLLRQLLNDENTSRRITALRLLAAIGMLTEEDRKALIHDFDEMHGNSMQRCSNGIDLVGGGVTTSPQVIFHILS